MYDLYSLQGKPPAHDNHAWFIIISQ